MIPGPFSSTRPRRSTLAAWVLGGALSCAWCAPTLAANQPVAAGDVVARPRLIILDVRDPENALGRSVKQALAENLMAEATRFGMVESISLAEIRAVLELETTKQEAGCETNDCAADVANAMGARYVLLSTASRLGSSWQLTVSLYDSSRTAAVGRSAGRANTAEGLATLVADLIEESMGPLGKPRPRKAVTQAPVAPPSPSAGSNEALVHINPRDVPLTTVEVDPSSLLACAFDTGSDRYDCGTAPTAVFIRSGSLATLGSATFLPDLSRGCVGPVKTEITLGGDAGRVDFQNAVGTEDGIARPMKPALATAPIPVSPGTRAADTLRPPAGCLGTAALNGDKDQVTVEVPYTVAGTPARAMWVRQRTRQPVEPRVLLERIPEPPQPAGPMAAATEAPWMVGTTVGVTAGVVTAVGGVALGLSLMPPSSTPEQLGLVGTFLGVLGAVVVGVPATAVGAVLDVSRHVLWEQGQDEQADLTLKARMHDAWQRRLAVPDGE